MPKSNQMVTVHLYVKHPMSPGDGEFLAVMNFSFCPRIGETILYLDAEYTVEKIQHSVSITKVIVSV